VSYVLTVVTTDRVTLQPEQRRKDGQTDGRTDIPTARAAGSVGLSSRLCCWPDLPRGADDVFVFVLNRRRPPRVLGPFPLPPTT
jgi:hypothetical protein